MYAITIDVIFKVEHAELRSVGLDFDGYIEKSVRVRSTCLAQYDTNRYSVPAQYAGQHISLRGYADLIIIVRDQKIIAEHERHFTKNQDYFEPWHYVPLLKQKPGALRDGAPFTDWQLSKSMLLIKDHYLSTKGGDRDFVNLLMLVQDHNIEVVEVACKLAVEQNTLRLAAIINLINQLVEPCIEQLPQSVCYPKLQIVPLADCKRYEQLTQQQARV